MATASFSFVLAMRPLPATFDRVFQEFPMSKTARIPYSIEFFPPKTPEGVEKLRLVRQQLYALKPEFCSVTFGAGGSTQEGTFNTVRDILAEGVSAASHFSCIGATRDTVRAQLAILKTMGVKRLVALRGDLPSGYGAGGEFHCVGGIGLGGGHQRLLTHVHGQFAGGGAHRQPPRRLSQLWRGRPLDDWLWPTA